MSYYDSQLQQTTAKRSRPEPPPELLRGLAGNLKANADQLAQDSGYAEQGEVRDRREIEIQTERLGNGIANLQSVAHELAHRLQPIVNLSGEPKIGEAQPTNCTKFGAVLNDMASDVEKLHSFLCQLLNSIEL